MNRCHFHQCINPAPVGQPRCDEHRLRWLPGKPAEPRPMSPFVRRALDRKLPAKAVA